MAFKPERSEIREGRSEASMSNLNPSITGGKIASKKTSERQHIKQPSQEAQAILRLYRQFRTWSSLAASLGVNEGLLWKVAHRKIARSAKVSAALKQYRLRRQRAASSDLQFLTFIQECAVPWLKSREKPKTFDLEDFPAGAERPG
ncbi:hypothetical protein MYX84_14870 [Acidobacteria bacterium AH-259-O06]|nr:hypothetical protein [Acidobacteria bacterium AH-259-O06]